MLSVLLALAGVPVQTTAGSAGAALTGVSGGAGLDVGAVGGGAGAAAGAETEDGMSVSVVDLLGAGFMVGTFTDDIMTTGAGGAAAGAGAVLTTAVEVDLTGSIEGRRGETS